MDYAEFRRHLGKAGLTVNAFAGYMGVTPTSVSNYARRGQVPRSYAMAAVLMGDAADRGVDFSAVLRRFALYPEASSANVHALPARRVDQQRGGSGT
ncbi:hypothetical protein LJR143_003596 [Pseudoxanthomonas sp. LjRoot143]|uniref:hypothetical protein n=1 Tax=Pseudoxanthomonas sp. LjRoot143 TaxID=3342266 RepID=UPI003ECC7CC1